MPNNLVFNNVASQLLVQIYGQNPSGQATAIQTDASGNLIASITPAFTETSTTIVEIADATVTVLTENTSQQKEYSFYVANLTANTFTALLQIAPDDVESLYVTEPTGNVAIEPSSKAVLTAQKFLKYTRLLVIGSTNTASASVYYNAKTL